MERAIKKIRWIENYYIELTDSNTRYRYWRDYRDRGTVFSSFKIKRLLEDKEYFNNLVNQGFNLVVDLNGESEKLKIPISIEYIKDSLIRGKSEQDMYKKKLEEFQMLNEKEQKESGESEAYLKNIQSSKSFDNIFIYRKISSKDIQEFYEFSSQIEVKGVRIYGWNRFNSTTHLFLYELFGDLERHNLYDKLFGEPEYHYDETPDAQVRYYKFPVSEIDKIIGIKKNFVIDSFDKDEYEYNGETKEYVLDLHQFDENIYETLKSYHVVEFEKVHDDEKKEPEKQSWWNRFFGKK